MPYSLAVFFSLSFSLSLSLSLFLAFSSFFLVLEFVIPSLPRLSRIAMLRRQADEKEPIMLMLSVRSRRDGSRIRGRVVNDPALAIDDIVGASSQSEQSRFAFNGELISAREDSRERISEFRRDESTGEPVRCNSLLARCLAARASASRTCLTWITSAVISLTVGPSPPADGLHVGARGSADYTARVGLSPRVIKSEHAPNESSRG